MGDTTYERVSRNSGAVPADTKFRTHTSTEAGHTDAEIQVVRLDTGDGTNTQPVSATNLDIRDLTATDIVTANPPASTLSSGSRLFSDGVGDLISVLCTNYRSVSVQLTGTWTGTVSFQVSNDNATWYACTGQNLSNLNSASTATSNSIFLFGINYAYFRVRFTTATSGTVTCTAYFNQTPIDRSHIIASLTAGAAHALKGEDGVHASGDYGIMGLAVRKDSATALAGADGDYAPFEVDANGRLWVASKDYLHQIAQGEFSTITPWTKVGYNPAIATAEEDLWSAGGSYTFPASAAGMEVRSDNATADGDIGTILFNATCDVGGTTTTMLDSGVNFAATAAAGDILIIEKSGTTPEWGVITTAANGSLTFTGGLSSGGSCATARTYQVLDASAATNAMAVIIEYLDATYATKKEIVILNTTTVVPTVNTDLFRINAFRVIAVGTKAGATYKPLGNIELRNLADTPLYSYITAGYTRARNAMYTVPLGKTLYITSWNAGWSTPNDTKVQTARMYTRANVEPASLFNTGNIFYPYTELLISNEQVTTEFHVPTKLPAKTDIKVSCIAFSAGAGAATSVLRGYLVG